VGQAPGAKAQHVCLICSMVARQARSLLDSNTPKGQQGPVVAHKKSNSNNTNRHVVSSFTVSAKVAPTSGDKEIFSSFTLSSENTTTDILPPKTHGTEIDWGMPPPAPRIPRAAKSAPTSPLGAMSLDSTKPELKGTEGSSLAPIPSLTRKRSESLGESSSSGGRRAVTFATGPEFRDAENESSLVAVELGEEAGADVEELGSPTRRARSASCHVLSSTRPSESQCGTIYEELGPSSSCDALSYHQEES
jgi:hypothetical protein